MIAIFTVLIAVVARLIPHIPNFTPVAAAALFGGTYLNKKYAIVLPIVVMIISDLFIGFDSIPSRVAVYGSFLLIGFIGLYLRKHKNFTNVVLASFAGSVLFFVITNAEVWAFSGMYAKDLSGLIQSYIMGIPFFRNTVLGDLLYTSVFFGAFEVATYYLKKTRFASLVS